MCSSHGPFPSPNNNGLLAVQFFDAIHSFIYNNAVSSPNVNTIFECLQRLFRLFFKILEYSSWAVVLDGLRSTNHV